MTLVSRNDTCFGRGQALLAKQKQADAQAKAGTPYACVHSCLIRETASMDSQRVGILDVSC